MTEASLQEAGGSGGAEAPVTAGGMLRAARERQGMHIAVLAATIKVSQRKLEALEADRYDELPDATFTRALSQTVCRALKIDAAPVLAKLPQGRSAGLEQVNGGLNTPFRERNGRLVESGPAFYNRPLVWAALAILIAAAALYFVPLPQGAAGLWAAARSAAASASAAAAAPAASAPVAPVSAPDAPASAGLTLAVDSAGMAGAPAASAASAAAVVETVYSAPTEGGAAAASDLPAGTVVVRVNEASWVEVVDADARSLLSRVVQPGESVGLEGSLPMRVKIGNAAGTQLFLRGQPVDLAASTRENIARLELK